MDFETIRAISYIVGCIHNKKNYSSIYDFQSGKYYNMSFSNTSVFDYSTCKFLSIMKNGRNTYSIFDYRTSNFINLDLVANTFKGYDFHSASFYNGSINNTAISFYSYQRGSFFQYFLT